MKITDPIRILDVGNLPIGSRVSYTHEPIDLINEDLSLADTKFILQLILDEMKMRVIRSVATGAQEYVTYLLEDNT